MTASEVWAYSLRECVECGRVFDLTDEEDSQKWYYGHDCEEPTNLNEDDADDA